jgi:hypothetical protein
VRVYGLESLRSGTTGGGMEPPPVGGEMRLVRAALDVHRGMVVCDTPSIDRSLIHP